MRTAATNAVGLLGAAVVAYGVALVFVPAGIILAGAALIALAWRLQS